MSERRRRRVQETHCNATGDDKRWLFSLHQSASPLLARINVLLAMPSAPLVALNFLNPHQCGVSISLTAANNTYLPPPLSFFFK